MSKYNPHILCIGTFQYKDIIYKRKSIEGRLNVPPFSNFKPGDSLMIRECNEVNNYGEREFRTIKQVEIYHSLDEFLADGRLKKVLPSASKKKIEEAKKYYLKFFVDRPKEVEEHGIIAIYF